MTDLDQVYIIMFFHRRVLLDRIELMGRDNGPARTSLNAKATKIEVYLATHLHKISRDVIKSVAEFEEFRQMNG